VRARLAALTAAGLLLTGASLTAHREVAAGNQALQANDPAKAASHYRSALKDRPDDPAVRYDLGTAHLAAGDLDRAVDDLGKAAAGAEGPLKAKADYNLGNALMARGASQGPNGKADLEAAVRAYRRAVAADPEDADARRNLQLAASRLAALKEPPQQPSGGGQQKPQQGGQQGKSQGSGQSAQGKGSSQQGRQGQPQQGQPQNPQAGAQGQQGNEKQDGPPSTAQAGKDQDGDRKGRTPGSPQENGAQEAKQGPDGQNGQAQAGAKGDATGNPAGDATAQGDKPLPDEVARVLSGLRRQEAKTLREALRNSLGPPKPEDKDW
jgi:Ca-activated chloride channel family protein